MSFARKRRALLILKYSDKSFSTGMTARSSALSEKLVNRAGDYFVITSIIMGNKILG